jgi:Type II CAAX prenyl endopeptidase Rce1-like
MSVLTPYLALGILPLAFLLGFSFNPPELFWGIRLALLGRSLEPMSASPRKVRERAAVFRRYSYFLGDAIIVSLVAVVAAKDSLSMARLGLHLDDWNRNIIVGLAAGIARVVAQRLIFVRVPIDPEDSFTWDVRRGRLELWVAIMTASAFSEELWIALCLVTLTAAWHTLVASVAVTIIIFAAVHYAYGFYGSIGVGAVEIVAALLFIKYRSLIPPFLFHLVGNLGSLYWHRYWRGGHSPRVER